MSEEELTRLQLQDHMTTTLMGSVLPEQSDPTSFKHVLDIGCGTGDWLIEAAKAYPTMTKMYGIDITGELLDYARAQAEKRGVQTRSEAGGVDAGLRLEFVVMDALRGLELPSHFFDLVNIRFAESWIRTSDWPKLLQEMQRVSKPGGVIRLTEASVIQTTSSGYDRLNRLLIQAFYGAEHYFAPEQTGMTTHLAEVLQQHGVLHVQTRIHNFESRGNTPAGQEFAEDMRLGYRTVKPFIKNFAQMPDDYEDIYQRMVVEMQAPDSLTIWRVLTAWGTTS
jgi:ubiquinone/menaquinone biosynthesis C-methylase UbiE